MKMVLITGTSSGVGKATADLYLEKGFAVFGLDIKPGKIQHRYYTHILCDVRNKDSLPSLPLVNTVINNAGTADDKTAIAVNLEGYINIAEKYCFQPNIKAVVNVGSISARAGLDSIRYCSSQGGRVSLTKHLAMKLGKEYGATVNCVSLGAVETGLEPKLYADKEAYKAVANEHILKRWMMPEECAEWIYFVAEINRAMTGQEILIDCGEEANYNFISVE